MPQWRNALVLARFTTTKKSFYLASEGNGGSNFSIVERTWYRIRACPKFTEFVPVPNLRIRPKFTEFVPVPNLRILNLRMCLSHIYARMCLSHIYAKFMVRISGCPKFTSQIYKFMRRALGGFGWRPSGIGNSTRGDYGLDLGSSLAVRLGSERYRRRSRVRFFRRGRGRGMGRQFR